jgi:hypothetical protein
MRYFYFFALLLVLCLPAAVYAQQPFEQFGVKVKILTLSNGRYPEFFDNDSLRRIGTVVYDTRLGRVAYLLPPDSLVGRLESDITARWMVVDPLAEKDAYISPYVFVRNNALLYTDPDGREVIVKDKKQRAEVARLINERAAGTFAFNSKGRLYLKERHLGEDGSDYYTSRLEAAIKDKDKINVGIGQTIVDNGKTKSVDNDFGGGVTVARVIRIPTTDPKTGKKTVTTEKIADVTISGSPNTNITDTNGQPLRDTPADILAHELVGHAIPRTVGTDTGDAVRNENKVRMQQPSGQNQQRDDKREHSE